MHKPPVTRDRRGGNAFRLTFLVGILSLVSVGADRPRPKLEKLKEHVTILASPEFEGRRGEGAQKAALYVEDSFKALKLKPLFEGSFRQVIPDRDPGTVSGVNIGAKIDGTDPKLSDEWLILAAHFDHLGKRGDRIYPGADDNASAVAMMLESARCFVESPERPKRSVMLIGFDLEEKGLFGSRYFADHMPIPMKKVKLFMTADMIARSMAGLTGDAVYVLGAERIPSLRPLIDRAAEGKPLDIGYLGSDIMVLDRSDYGPFRFREVPYLFFSTGESEHYHKTTDIAATLNYPKFDAITQVMYAVFREAADLPELPNWSKVQDNPVSEAKTIAKTLEIFLAHKERLELSSTQLFLINNAQKTLERVIARGHYEGSERTSIITIARIILSTAM